MLKNLKPKAAEAKRLADEQRREIEKLPWSEIKSYANVFMAGYVEDLGDVWRTKYLSDDPGPGWMLKERDGRIAIVKLLRSLPFEQDFFNRLAALFDPDDGTHPAIDRKLIFSPARPNHLRNSAIAVAVAECVLSNNTTVTKAWEDVAKRFGFDSSDRIKQIWSAKRIPIICGYIHDCILAGDDETEALEKAEKHFGSKNESTKKDSIKKFWSKYREWVKQIEGPFSGESNNF
jgi:hypothetical protein